MRARSLLSPLRKNSKPARGSFDYAEFLWYGALAGIGQAENSESAYGQGAEGYAERYGSEFADGTIEDFATKAVFPSLLRQDPRYFRLGKGRIGHRAWYAVSGVFITRSDNGRSQFNFSEIRGCGQYLRLQLPPCGRRTVVDCLDRLGRAGRLRRCHSLLRSSGPTFGTGFTRPDPISERQFRKGLAAP